MKSLRSKQHTILVDELRRLRGLAKVTQSELAQRLGVPQSYVAKVENLERRLDVVELVWWLDALGLTEAGQSILERVRAG